MDLTVVIASTDAERSIDACLRSIHRACASLHAEVLLVDASRDDTLARARASGLPVRTITMEPGTLTPRLWTAGLRQASGRVVAFTTGHCLAGDGWARALVDAVDRGASGAGGPLVLAEGTSALDWAIFFLRYSAFTPARLGAGRVTGEIAGDNAAYPRAALDRHAGALADGFWEVEFHRLLRAEGGWLEAVPEATAAFGPSFPVRTILEHRFAHGRHFGAYRVASGLRRAWQVVTAAPLVPALLAARVAGRVWSQPGERWRFLASLPQFALLSTSWAAGEAVGAIRGGTP